MFMCVGGVIYYEGGFQDARFLGGLALKAPLIYLFFVSSHFSLIGFPFMSGFYSKELILGGFLSGNSCIVGFSLLFFSLVLTICYSVRIIILVRIQNNTGVVCCYYPIDFFYYLAVILMGNGAVGIGVILQKVFLKINFFCYISIYFFYFSWFFRLIWVLNFLVIFWFYNTSFFRDFLKHFVGRIWFLKNLSGSLLRRTAINLFSNITISLEIGWVRGYFFGCGLKEVIRKLSINLHKINFGLIGILIFVGLLLFVFLRPN